MSNGNQPDAGSSARELPETQGRGRESQSPESLEPIHESATIHHPIHEDATILGGPGIQAAQADQSAAGGGLGSITDPSEFRRAVLEIGLATEDELDGLTADVPASAGVLGLARALQKAGKLTAYQAAALYQRKSRGLLDRQLPDPRQAGRRRHGRGLQGPTPPARTRRGLEDPPALVRPRSHRRLRGSSGKSRRPASSSTPTSSPRSTPTRIGASISW